VAHSTFYGRYAFVLLVAAVTLFPAFVSAEHDGT
jgi:hypothetical protein